MWEKESIIQMTGGLLIRYFTEEIPLGYPFSFEKFRDNVAFFILYRQYFDGSKKKNHYVNIEAMIMMTRE
jgi:hypothetical protein